MAYIQFLCNSKHIPVFNKDFVPRDILLEAVKLPQSSYAMQQLGQSGGRSYQDYWADSSPIVATPQPVNLYESQQAPLYYWIVRPIYVLAGASGNFINSLAALRLLNLAFLAVAVLFFSIAIRRLSAAQWVRESAITAFAFSPVLLMNSTRVANDGLAIVAAAITFLCFVILAMRDTPLPITRHLAVCFCLGGLTALACLVKMTNLAMVVVGLLVIWMCPRFKILGAAMFVLAYLVVVSPYFAYSLQTYGVLVPAQETILNHNAGKTLIDYLNAIVSIHWIDIYISWWTDGTIWAGGWSFVQVNSQAIGIYHRIVEFAIMFLVVGVMFSWLQYFIKAGQRPPMRKDLILCGCMCISYMLALSIHCISSKVAWGVVSTCSWYLAPAIPCMLYLVCQGIHFILRPRLAAVFCYSIPLVYIVAEVTGLYIQMPLAYAGKPLLNGGASRLASIQTSWLGTPTLVVAVIAELLMICILCRQLLTANSKYPANRTT